MFRWDLPWRPALLLAPLALGGLARPAAAQIVTENAGVVSPETPILRESLTFSDSQHLDEVRWSHQWIQALDRTRELKLTVPVLWREARFPGAGGEEQEELLGLGDVSLRFKQGLWRQDDVMESTRWAALAEVGAPTGDDDAEEDGTPVPRQLQLGAGDWSLGGGTAFTWIRDRRRFSAEAFYRHRTRHDGVQLGASADLNLAYWYRLSPDAFRPGVAETEVRGVLELLSSYAFASEVGSDTQDDDGPLVWLAPGLHVYRGGGTLLELGFQLPLHQDIDDDLGERHWAATLVVKFLF